MNTKPFKYKLLKDGTSVFESRGFPGWAQFFMQELKPEHTWTVEEIPQSEEPKTIEELKSFPTLPDQPMSPERKATLARFGVLPKDDINEPV